MSQFLPLGGLKGALPFSLAIASGTCLLPFTAAIASAPPSQFQLEAMHGEVLLAQEAMIETVLSFETESMAVRIYRQGEDLFMNLYNKETDIVEVSGTPAELVPSTRDQTVYKNSLGEADRFARININGQSELEIVGSDGTVVLKEPGFNTVIGVANGETYFQGRNFAPGTGAIVIASRYANLRKNPDASSEVMNTVPRREIVDVLDRVGNLSDGYIWYKVLYNGQTGWVRGDLLQPA